MVVGEGEVEVEVGGIYSTCFPSVTTTSASGRYKYCTDMWKKWWLRLFYLIDLEVALGKTQGLMGSKTARDGYRYC